ncbi:MAG TPA: hypothetical protein VLC46_02775 [Thermoanaerobaculia bacterium]|jgi:hypothetical protein|nr:hypothetical protein [Thermoanaerobaculia bacterium]
MFEASRLRVARAREHLAALKLGIDTFFNQNPYTPFYERGSEPDERLIRLRVHAQPGPMLGILSGEVAHHLRGALDYAVGELVALGTGVAPDSGRHFAFPIYAQRSRDYKSAIKKNLNGVQSSAVTVIDSVQPFQAQGGEPERSSLYLLHRIDIENKHRALHVLLGGAGLLRFSHRGKTGARIVSIPARWVDNPYVFPVEDGTVAFSFFSSGDPESHMDIEIDTFIGFANPAAAYAFNVPRLLESAAADVDVILSALEDVVS